MHIYSSFLISPPQKFFLLIHNTIIPKIVFLCNYLTVTLNYMITAFSKGKDCHTFMHFNTI